MKDFLLMTTSFMNRPVFEIHWSAREILYRRLRANIVAAMPKIPTPAMTYHEFLRLKKGSGLVCTTGCGGGGGELAYVLDFENIVIKN